MRFFNVSRPAAHNYVDHVLTTPDTLALVAETDGHVVGFLLPPVSLADARRALRGLRMWPLLQGFRGAPAADVARLEELVVNLGRLAVDVPEIAELDLNPVMVGEHDCSVVDLRLRLASTDEPGPGTPRQLRRVE